MQDIELDQSLLAIVKIGIVGIPIGDCNKAECFAAKP